MSATGAAGDPLLLLRNALTTSSKVTLLALPPTPPSDIPTPVDLSKAEEVYTLPQATHIQLSSKGIFPSKTSTRYTSSLGATDAFFDLETLLFVYLTREDNLPEYLKKCRDSGIAFVSVMERGVVCDWLSGKSSVDGPEGRIVPLAGASEAASAPTLTSSPLKRPHDDSSSVPPDAPVPSSSTIANIPSSSAAPPKKARYAPDKTDQEKVKQLVALMEGPAYAEGTEKVVGTLRSRDTVLRGDRTNNFESLRNALQTRIKILREEPSSSSASAPKTDAPKKKKQRDPIIIVSPSSTALITMHNVKRFLEEAVFEPSSDVLKRLAAENVNITSRQAEDMIPIYHTVGSAGGSASLTSQANATGRKQRFIVIDGVEALAKFGQWDDAWDRVVCVMTTGQEWQFRPYKWREPKELFHHVKGIHFQWTSDAVNPKVRNWNVAELRIDPSKRHIDKSVVTDFWRLLDTWVQNKKSGLVN